MVIALLGKWVAFGYRIEKLELKKTMYSTFVCIVIYCMFRKKIKVLVLVFLDE